MAIDVYSQCPCGSGKKIKFCRCRETLAGHEEVFRLIEGGQLVAALDQINKLIEQNPTAAWLFAVKGRILLEVEDQGPLRENAERFLRLQPDNPLALAQQAAVDAAAGKLPAAANSLLSALAESKEGIDSLILDISTGLAFSLLQQGNILSSRMYASLPLSLKGYERSQVAASLLSQVDRDSSLNLLLKQLPSMEDLPAKAVPSERLAEALRLLHAHRVSQAQDKLRALERQTPQDPQILMALIECAVWLCDQRDQVKWLRRLSECESLPLDFRANQLACSALLDLEPIGLLTSAAQELSWELTQVDGLMERMTTDPRCVAVPDSLARQMVNEEEVPPRAVYQLLDGPLLHVEGGLPSADQCPRVLTMVAVFGRQTDRPPLVVAQAVLKTDVADVTEKLQTLIGNDANGSVKENPTAIALESKYSVIPPMFRITSRGDGVRFTRELNEARLADQLLDLPLQLFEGKSARQSAQQNVHEVQRTALVRILENSPELGNYGDALVDRIRAGAGVAALPDVLWSTVKQRSLSPSELNRLNPDDLQDPRELVGLIQAAKALRLSRLGKRAAERLRQIPLTDEYQPLLVAAYQFLAEQAATSDDALRILEEGKGRLPRGSQPLAALLLAEIPLRLVGPDPHSAAEVINRLVREYQQDATVMAQLQHLLMELGVLRPNAEGMGRPLAAGQTREAASPSGLWTPQGATEAAPEAAPASGASGSGSKLWLPGMD